MVTGEPQISFSPKRKKKTKLIIEEDNAIRNDIEFFAKKYNTVKKFDAVYKKVEKMAKKFVKKLPEDEASFVGLVLKYFHQVSGGEEFSALGGDKSIDTILPFLEELKKKGIIKFELVHNPE